MRLILAVALLAAAAGCPAGPDLEARYPVAGSVTVAGKPAGGLFVNFNLEAGGDPRAPTLVTISTDAEGKFAVSQNSPGDGLAPGDYAVTFLWPPGGDIDAQPKDDQLRGRYLDAKVSKFRVKIEPRSNDLPPFELK